MHRTCLRVAFKAPSRLVSSTRGLPWPSLVFWGVSILPDFLVRGFAFLGLQKVCRLVLCLVGRGRGLVSKIPGWHLELGHGGVGEAITLKKILISSRVVIWVLTKGWRPSWKNWLRSGFCPIVNFYLLVPGVLSNTTPSDMYRNPWVWTQPKARGPFFRPGSDACTGTNGSWFCHKKTWL